MVHVGRIGGFINVLLTDAHFQTQETATSREGPINQAKSSSMLLRRACNSRSNHVCPASVNHDHDCSCGRENLISYSCCRTRNVGEDISELRDECSGGDAVDTVPSRDCGELVPSGADRKNEFAKPVDEDWFGSVASVSRLSANKLTIILVLAL